MQDSTGAPPIISIPSQTMLAGSFSDTTSALAEMTALHPRALPTVMEGSGVQCGESPTKLSMGGMGSKGSDAAIEENTASSPSPDGGLADIRASSIPVDVLNLSAVTGPGPVAEASEPGFTRPSRGMEEAKSNGTTRKWSWQPKKTLMSFIGAGGNSSSSSNGQITVDSELFKQNFNKSSQLSRLKTGRSNGSEEVQQGPLQVQP